MRDLLSGALVGLIFGLGLVVSMMMNPLKVLSFLDVTGAWDPSLALVMAGALAVTMLGYRFVLRRERPMLAASFSLPAKRDIDARLVAGAAIFGIGWGLAGFCPGPAITALGTGEPRVALFVAAMALGMVAARMGIERRDATKSAT